MSRTITVKGTGYAEASPDTIVLEFRLESRVPEYSKAMELNAIKLDELQNALSRLGFDRTDLKTGSYDVSAEYSNVKTPSGDYTQKFAGYLTRQNLRLRFPLDTKRLGEVLAVISGCIANPQLSISFTVSDQNALKAEVLRSAAADARSKAGILADASGVSLGKILSINYNRGEVNVSSPFACRLAYDAPSPDHISNIDLQPESIHVSDTVIFVWELW